jgi:hypothetical protein
MNNPLSKFFSRKESTVRVFRFFAGMILRIITSLLVAVFSAGSEASPQPQTKGKNYPAIIKDSPELRAKAEREWRRMLDSYSIQQTPPDLYPITNTPRSLLGISGGIPLLSVKPEPGTEVFARRGAVKTFIDRWRDLIGIDPTAISLTSADVSTDTERLTYRQANYPYPVAGNFGEMVAVVSFDGRLTQLDDRFVPVVDLPSKPSTDRDIAAKKILGRTFSYTDIAGREQRIPIGAPNEVSVKRLVILPIEKGDSIEVRLAWEIIAGRSISWTVYIDAVNGEEIKVVQNFQT